MNPAPQFRVVPTSELHLVSNPFHPAYARYYDFVGLVTDTAVPDALTVCVSGVVEQRDGQRWAFRRKPSLLSYK